MAGLAELGSARRGREAAGGRGAFEVVPDGWTGFRLRPGVTGEEPFVTNDLGMHAPRTYRWGGRPGHAARRRARVVGGLRRSTRASADTIPGAVERELRAAGHRAEVLNFGTHGFSIVNVSALLQAYVHQFQPDVVVVVVDLQVGLAALAAVRAGRRRRTKASRSSAGGRRSSSAAPRRSALLAVFDDPRPARRWIRRATGLPLRPRASPAPRLAVGRATEPPTLPPGRPPPLHRRTAGDPCLRGEARARAGRAAGGHGRLRRREVHRALLRDALRRLLRPHRRRAGAHERAPLPRGGGPRPRQRARARSRAEVELVTRVVRRVARGGSARVIDMLEASRRSSLRDLARLHRGRHAPHARGQRGSRPAHRDADPPGPAARRASRR